MRGIVPNKVDARVLLNEFDDIIRNLPTVAEIATPRASPLIGRIKAVVESWNFTKTLDLETALSRINSSAAGFQKSGYMLLLNILHEARYSLYLETGQATGAVFDKGATFDYFEELRKKITLSKSDLLFVDPYIDPDFIARYLPQVAKTVKVRLLTNKYLSSLIPATQQFIGQHGVVVEVRSDQNLHDRFVFIDQIECFQSGASFKDGAKNAPALLTPIIDAFKEVRNMYESRWSSAKVEL